jgi:hypothetical protein
VTGAAPKRAAGTPSVDEILRAHLERRGVCACGAFGIHCEPDLPDDNSNDASGDVFTAGPKFPARRRWRRHQASDLSREFGGWRRGVGAAR